jgi:hypothetical protein
VNGLNSIGVYASDYGANADTVSATVRVDNAPPGAVFTDPAPDDPEVVRVRVEDAHSGVASARIEYRAVGSSNWQPLATQIAGGEARARVASSAVPPGEYEFKATVTDIAGNTAETTLREDAAPMRLTFPLRAGVQLRAGLGEGASPGQTVAYGTDSEVRGRLLDARGEPLPNQPVVVVDRFANGALYPRAERPTVTDQQGRFTVPEPAGPSRSIEVEFAGTSRYLPAVEPVGRFSVKGAASFRTSSDTVAEGSPITFTGRVRHRGARIPAGGKLVEIQYRLKTGRQRTLKQPFRTDANGRYRLNYRFSKALTADALFRFRVKVRKEGNWPFKDVASRWRKVVVRAN